MRIDELLALQRVFHEADHATQWGLESVVKFPTEAISRWDGARLGAVAVLATRLRDATVDPQLRANLEAIGEKVKKAVEKAEEDARARRREALVDRKSAATDAAMFGAGKRSVEGMGDVG